MLYQPYAYLTVFHIGIHVYTHTQLCVHLHLHHLSPSVQPNIKLLIVLRRQGLPCAIFICLENNVSLGDQAVNIEESVYILCQMLFI